MKLEEKVLDIVEPVIAKEGFEVEYIEFVKEGNDKILRIVIDKPGDLVSIDDCENISRKLEDDIDKVIEKEYVLEVSSPGLERQLKNVKLYRKYVGENIHVRLYEKINQAKEFDGILKTVSDDNMSVCIEAFGEEININIDKIASCHTIYDFTQDLKANKEENVNINQLNRF